MRKLKVFSILCVLFVAVFTTGTVIAQDEVSEYPEYVVQSGDTLTTIAIRFNISLEELTSANEINDPNQVYVGDVLLLPGIDWVDGFLDVENVPVGETFRSLRRRFGTDETTMARVGGIISPSQVYAEYPMMMASEIGEDWEAGRVSLGKGESLLSLSASSGVNSWEMIAKNQVSDLWAGVKSDVLLVPGSNNPGPGALPSPLSFQVLSGSFTQGKTVVLEMTTGGESVNLSGELVGHPLNFMEVEAGDYIALQGVHVMTEPGPYLLSLSGEFENGRAFEFSQLVRVSEGGYGQETITVDPQFLDPTVDNAEIEFVANLTSPVTSEKMWSGYFSQPTPFDIFINSSFGTRRSYNGSEYTYFHSGVDFGGGEGADVICPANGRVVFAGKLEVRGNATIIDHGWGVYTGYWHQSQTFVQEGDMVQEGQIIGLVGNTGRSAGAHLHWELWVGGVQVEPLDWLVQLYP